MMNRKDFVLPEIAQQLKELDFNELCNGYYHNEKLNSRCTSNNKEFSKESEYSSAPTILHVIEWLDSKGYYIDITPEFYKDGINWNWQIFWYLPKEKQIEETEFESSEGTIQLSNYDRFVEGTIMYGDNNEYPTRPLAINAAIEKAIEILKQK